ncbi:hypothetical protein MTP99_009031 [Tenebrio molitor]|jgi:hypothetical protein|uniref:Uncharacterized protein n=1 Tax=Tenebrio molitor TaxID=7067 RepID=A0A8J6HSA9_TENMO|nr:hypothetical protein GEV33_003007 [Tenebrio molitor]KAJ3636196.1 hypothetical protein MTP99_009031 [Tenebrio molitor]
MSPRPDGVLNKPDRARRLASLHDKQPAHMMFITQSWHSHAPINIFDRFQQVSTVETFTSGSTTNTWARSSRFSGNAQCLERFLSRSVEPPRIDLRRKSEEILPRRREANWSRGWRGAEIAHPFRRMLMFAFAGSSPAALGGAAAGTARPLQELFLLTFEHKGGTHEPCSRILASLPI